MNRRTIFTAFAALATLAYVLVGANDPTIPEPERFRPTRNPDRVILTWSGDPATTQSVTWRTDISVTTAVAEIAEATDGPEFRKSPTQLDAASENMTTDLGEARYHSVQFTSLKPDTQYVYRVGDGFNWSEWNQFRTAVNGPAPLEFLYVGDAQNDIFAMWSRLIRSGYSEAPKARFIVHAGDLINRSTRDVEWGEWHAAAGWINRSVVSFPVPGNHEYGNKTFTPNWRPQFTLPINGVPGLEETNYYLDIQGVRMVAMNTNLNLPEQAAWLDNLLAKNPQQWTIVVFHHPVFSAARNRDNKVLRETLQPIFDKHRVDMVLTGHDHTYARSNLMTGANVREGGTMYVVSVSGPKMYNLDRESWMQRAAENTQLCQIIRIDGPKLRYESRTARGIVYDAFELVKQKGKSNRLVNRTPSTPERMGGVAK